MYTYWVFSNFQDILLSTKQISHLLIIDLKVTNSYQELFMLYLQFKK